MLSFMHRFAALEQGIRSTIRSRFHSITTRAKKEIGTMALTTGFSQL
jgi:hypothetical protein